MVPAQPVMDIKPDCKLQNSTNIVIDRENKNVQDTSDGLGLRCKNECEETINQVNTLLDGKATIPKDFEDVEVDIVTCTKINETKSALVEDPDATEYSSSFADTTSDPEKCSGLSEAEMESQFFGDSDLASPFDDAFSSIFQTRCVLFQIHDLFVSFLAIVSAVEILYTRTTFVFLYVAFAMFS
jgi:hypothetical protein